MIPFFLFIYFSFLTYCSFYNCLYLREACENAMIEKHFSKITQMGGDSDEAANSYMEELASLEEVFRKASEADEPTEVRPHSSDPPFQLTSYLFWSWCE